MKKALVLLLILAMLAPLALNQNVSAAVEKSPSMFWAGQVMTPPNTPI